MGIPAPAGVSAAGAPPAGDQANAVLSGQFLAVGPSAPFAFRIVDAYVLISTAIALSTVQLRDTSGGGGAALSSALTSATAGTIRNNDTATPTVASGGSVFLRRSDRGVAGEVIVVAVRN